MVHYIATGPCGLGGSANNPVKIWMYSEKRGPAKEETPPPSALLAVQISPSQSHLLVHGAILCICFILFPNLPTSFSRWIWNVVFGTLSSMHIALYSMKYFAIVSTSWVVSLIVYCTQFLWTILAKSVRAVHFMTNIGFGLVEVFILWLTRKAIGIWWGVCVIIEDVIHNAALE